MTLRLTPDGKRYLRMARGEREPIPFHLRWLLPRLLGENERAWIGVNVASILALGPLTYLLATGHGATPAQALAAAALLLGLPSVRFLWRVPVLVDTPMMALAVGAAVLAPLSVWAALVVVTVGAMVNERTPIWAAIFALEPVLLAAVVLPLLRPLVVAPGVVGRGDPNAWTFELRSVGLRAHAGKWRDPFTMLLPWGACLAVLFAAPTLWLGLAVAAGYAQLLVATDTVRLYQMAAPVVCVSAAMVIPLDLIVPVLAAHWFNPFTGGGL